MTTWNDVHADAPDLADRVAARFAAHGLGLLATLRADGSPRISGIEPLVAHGEVWMGMMPGSRKDADVRRDPRIALHSATVDKNVAEGDARISGRVVEVTDDEAFERFLTAFASATGHDAPPERFPLYTIDVGEVMFLQPGGDHLVIESWTPTRGYRRVERR